MFCPGHEGDEPNWTVKFLKFTWYSPSATCWIYLYDLEHGLRIHEFYTYLTLSDCEIS